MAKHSNFVLTEELKSQYPLTQINSQKYLGPPTWYQGPEPKGLTEIFISNLVTSVDIYQVFELVLPYGSVYQVRLPVTFTEAKGFAYVRFILEGYASEAIYHLNGKEFLGRTLKAERSWDTRVLQILNWPKYLTEEESLEILRARLQKVKSAKLFQNKEDFGNTGFIIVEFDSHNAAAVGRRDIKSNILYDITHAVHSVGWARFDFDIPEDRFRLVTDLYVGNLPPETQLEDLKGVISFCVDIRKVIVKINSGGFGFLYFNTHDEATEALLQLKAGDVRLNGQLLQFHWVKGEYSKKKRTSTSPEVTMEVTTQNPIQSVETNIVRRVSPVLTMRQVTPGTDVSVVMAKKPRMSYTAAFCPETAKEREWYNIGLNQAYSQNLISGSAEFQQPGLVGSVPKTTLNNVNQQQPSTLGTGQFSNPGPTQFHTRMSPIHSQSIAPYLAQNGNFQNWSGSSTPGNLGFTQFGVGQNISASSGPIGQASPMVEKWYASKKGFVQDLLGSSKVTSTALPGTDNQNSCLETKTSCLWSQNNSKPVIPSIHNQNSSVLPYAAVASGAWRTNSGRIGGSAPPAAPSGVWGQNSQKISALTHSETVIDDQSRRNVSLAPPATVTSDDWSQNHRGVSAVALLQNDGQHSRGVSTTMVNSVLTETTPMDIWTPWFSPVMWTPHNRDSQDSGYDSAFQGLAQMWKK